MFPVELTFEAVGTRLVAIPRALLSLPARCPKPPARNAPGTITVWLGGCAGFRVQRSRRILDTCYHFSAPQDLYTFKERRLDCAARNCNPESGKTASHLNFGLCRCLPKGWLHCA